MSCSCESGNKRLSRNDACGGDNSFLPYPRHFATIAAHAGHEPERWNTLSVSPVLVLSSIYKQKKSDELTGYFYGRINNPTRDVLEECMAKLHSAKHCVTFSSGLAAICCLLALLKSGDHILCGDDTYGGTSNVFSVIGESFGIKVTYVDAADPKDFLQNIRPNTKMIFVETPTNPCMKVIDISLLAKIAKRNRLQLVVDNTVVSCYLQQPLAFGADVVACSLSNYYNGHSDSVMGALIFNCDEMNKIVRTTRALLGNTPSPFDCFQVVRGMKTLALRLKKQSNSALAIASLLECHPKVEKVLHPGLSSHLQHQVAKRQMSGHSGVFSFYLKGNEEDCKSFMKRLRYFMPTVSFGSVNSLVEMPYFTSHACIPLERKREVGITENMIRLSVGIENLEDLIEDIKWAMDGCGCCTA